MDAQNTLLAEAVAAGEARVLEDTTTPYLEVSIWLYHLDTCQPGRLVSRCTLAGVVCS